MMVFQNKKKTKTKQECEISNILAGNRIGQYQNTQNITKIAKFATQIDNSQF